MMARTLFYSFILLVCGTAALINPGTGNAAAVEVGKQTLAKDTLWSGEILVTGDVHVPQGVTLTITPGTTIKFKKIGGGSDRNLFGTDSPYYPQAEIIVTGRLVAKGTGNSPILFTSAEQNPQPSDWGALNFLGGSGNIVEHCRVEYAYNGVHAHGSQVEIRQDVFANNAVAISVKKEEEAKGTPGFGIPADIIVSGNLIESNKGGINVRSSRAKITGNTIRDNKFFGIWVKEQCSGEISLNDITRNQKGIFFYKATGMTISRNNIHGNFDYNLAIADEQEKPVEARGNWLGQADPVKAREQVFDKDADPSVAQIVIEPLLKERVSEAGMR